MSACRRRRATTAPPSRAIRWRPTRSTCPSARPRPAGPADRTAEGTAAHDGDPLPAPQEWARVRRRCGRRARPRWPRGSRSACSSRTCPRRSTGAEVFSLDTSALLAGTRFRGDFEERFKAVLAALGKRKNPILFIDELHSIIGAGATTGGTMDLATLLKPVLTSGGLRVDGLDHVRRVQADREGPRALAPLPEGAAAGTDGRGDGEDPAGAAEAIRRTPPCRRTRWRPSTAPRNWRHVTCATTGCRIPRSTCLMRPERWCACRRRRAYCESQPVRLAQG